VGWREGKGREERGVVPIFIAKSRRLRLLSVLSALQQVRS